MKVALAQINPIIGAFDKNSEKILSFTQEAKKQGADLVVFPELSLVGYPPLDLLDKDHFVDNNLKALKNLLPHIRGIAILVGSVDKNTHKSGKKLFNSAALISNGKIISKHVKSLLPSYDVFDETRHFEPASSHHIQLTRLNRTPLAVSICEDIWNDKDFWKRRLYTFNPLSVLSKHKSLCLINLSASPFSMGKHKLRMRMLESLSKKYKVPSIYVNQVGSNDELIFDGGSFALNSKGKIIAQCRDFGEDLALLDLDTQEGTRHEISNTDMESIFKALVLGIRDYVHKCGFSKVLLGLSGGIDSALTAALATEALGPENVIGVLMPSRYSSEGSLKDAHDLVNNLKIKSLTIPIHELFETYLKSLTPLFKNENSSLTEENLQARIRGNLLMSLSNQWGALVLTTGNKSELATGYCTLYGDMSGGLAVLSDVPKTLVYDLSRYINTLKNVIPQNSITKPPSAELRPNQTDQDTLPPYSELDQILKAYVEEHAPISTISKRGFPESLVRDIVQRIDRNEYKRRQAPPGLRITHKAFGIGRRLPITQQYREGSLTQGSLTQK
ncbi:MAG: NAD+ synthase [Deltaproteobacteria bacterium]|nr:NAD+ synthase [Deltaproteobacteria bacterium]